MEKQKKSKAIIILSIILGISILFNILLFLAVGTLEMIWENDYNNLDTEWCEISNDQTTLINDFAIEFSKYDAGFLDFRLELIDCWS